MPSPEELEDELIWVKAGLSEPHDWSSCTQCDCLALDVDGDAPPVKEKGRTFELHPGVCTIVPAIVQDDANTITQGVGVRGGEPELQDGQDDIRGNRITYRAVVHVVAVLTFDITEIRARQAKSLPEDRPRS